MNWTSNDMPTQTGRTAIVTGANSGLGFYTAKGLAEKGARVILACRNLERGEAAMQSIREQVPNAELVLKELDLADLNSVSAFARDFRDNFRSLHLLINNAGLMAIPYRRTKDGFEMQFGVNHLGHFALTGRLIDLLVNTPGARIVTVSSNAHYIGKINFEDLASEKKYSRMKAYGMSKLANLLFTAELQKRLQADKKATLSLAAHPGYADSNLFQKGLEMMGASWLLGVGRFINRVFAQSTAMGALPVLFAASSPDVEPGGYYGPDGFRELRGYPVRVYPRKGKMDSQVMQKLWEESIRLTGVDFLS